VAEVTKKAEVADVAFVVIDNLGLVSAVYRDEALAVDHVAQGNAALAQARVDALQGGLPVQTGAYTFRGLLISIQLEWHGWTATKA